ncbi:MAG: FtsW/RodA/SpoVE family cell cycle protein [Bacteroidales bacterium]|nr:FtsW/RodA/SpoVE family cell cycle protein [Bacteroidales bacterium]
MAGRKKTFWNFFENTEGDKVVWIIVLVLIMFSILCIFSSTSRLLGPGQSRLDLVWDHLKIVLLGLGLILACYFIPSLNFFRKMSSLGFILSLGLLALLISGLDLGFVRSIEINGARRIIQVGPLQLHVNEVVKVAMVLYLAWAIDAYKKKSLKLLNDTPVYQKILYIYVPFLLTTLLLLPGSNSAALFTGGIMFLVILISGDSTKDLGILLLAGIAALGICVGIYKISDGKLMKRIGTGISRVFDKEDYEAIVMKSRVGSVDYYQALDEIRQPYSAKIAVHQGGFIGKGPGQSTQRYVVPDISEDYMYSFIIEEYGILGGMVILFLYLSLLARSIIIVRNCGKDLYAKLSVAGLSLLICGQAFLHICVNVDIGPMTGQTLPLVSHGASAFLCFCIAFGVILSISKIASKRIEKETMNADPLVDRTQEVTAIEHDLSDLDDFESGNIKEDELNDEDYGL